LLFARCDGSVKCYAETTFTVGKETALEDLARCPVCDQELPLDGPDGVMVHLLAIHPDSAEARWITNELDVLVREASG
jgi:hypothetical protein